MTEPVAVPPEGQGFKLSPPRLDLSVERYAAFKSWKAKWDDYVMLSALDSKSAEYQAAMLRYTFTDNTRQIYESLKLSENDNHLILSVTFRQITNSHITVIHSHYSH